MNRRRGDGDPIRVLELRSVFGTGGGPEKTILFGAAATDPARTRVTVCYVRDARDSTFSIDRRARELGIDYVEIVERHSFDLRVWRQLRAVVAERDIDVVHSHDYKTDLLAWLLARFAGVKAISTAHGWTGQSSRETRYYYPANKRLLKRFPLVIAVSSEIRAELLAHGARADRVHVLLNGIDPARFRRDPRRVEGAGSQLGLPAGGPVIGSVGRLARQKRFDHLIRAFAAVIAHQWPTARLAIAGEGEERSSLETLAVELGVADRCHLIGQVDDVVGFHHAIDVFVQSSEYEGTPNVVLEAMALETPIVATDVGGTAELCRADIDGLIVAPGSPEALAAAIQRVLDSPAETAARTRAARSRIEADLSFSGRVRRLENLYDALMQG
jgi:glycosyltransferase involved in cell wall biosynthesis